MSESMHPELPGTNPERILIRLFRIMKSYEQDDLIRNALKILGKRCSFSEWRSPKLIREEIEGDEDLDERVFSAWPAEFPSQEIIEFDNLGDPGGWLYNRIGEPIVDVLFASYGLIEDISGDMANEYLHEIRQQGYSMPSDFGDNPTYDSWTDEEEDKGKKGVYLFFCALA